MRYLFLASSVLIVKTVLGQEGPEKKPILDLWAGAKVRATTIYPKGYPGAVQLPAVNAFEQPGKHLDGPGIEISQSMFLAGALNIIFTQGLRYDYIYQRFSLEQIPPPDFKYSIKRKMIFDLFAEIEQSFQSNHNWRFNASLGGGIYGLNTGYYLTERFYQTPAVYTEKMSKKNFIFPAVFLGVGWRYKKFHTAIRLGYCWNDPTLLKSPFLFPEIVCRYKISSFFKTD